MSRKYGVWANTFEDNDTADWYYDRDEAYDAWHKLAESLEDGETASMQRFTEAGDVDEDFAHELRRENGELHEYYGSERLWA